MWKRNLLVLGMLTWLAAGASAGTSNVIDPNTLGAAFAMPYLTQSEGLGQRITVATVTNGSTYEPINLHLTWVSGTDWASIDFDCPLTPLESTYLVFERFGDTDTAIVHFECSDDGSGPGATGAGKTVMRQVPGANGMLFAAVECQSSLCPPAPPDQEGPEPRTLLSNVLSADFVVMDFGSGNAFSAPAIHIQARGAAPPFDQNYRFSGLAGQYAAFPSTLTTSYLAPDDSITAELLLFTLDGRAGSGPGVAARLAGYAYDDDENATSGSIRFDCLTVAPIDASPNAFGLNVTRPFSGHISGHLRLAPTAIARNDEHERNQNNDGVRVALVHGYLVQTISSGGEFNGGEFGDAMSGKGAWARQLTQGTNPLLIRSGDVPSFDARPKDFSSQP